MRNLQTFGAPYWKKIVICTTIVLSWNFTNAQQFNEKLSLEPLSSYKTSLKAFYNKKWGNDRKALKTLNVRGYWHLLPSIGLNFGLPSVSWSLGNYINFRQEKKRIEANLESLDGTAQNEFLGILQELENRYFIVQSEIRKIAVYEKKEKFQRALYEIQRECCQKNECKPSECILADLQMVQYEEEKELLKITATQKIRELEMFSKFNIPKENIWYSQNECIMESEEFKIIINK